jgi:hypothetical protein
MERPVFVNERKEHLSLTCAGPNRATTIEATEADTITAN